MTDADSTSRISEKVTSCMTCDAKVAYRTTAKVYCSPCRAIAKKDRDRLAAERKRIRDGVKPVKGTKMECPNCKRFFERRNIKNVRCSPCQAEHVLRKARQASKAKARERGCRELGSKDECKHCGKVIVIDAPRKAYCDDCRILQYKGKLPHLVEWNREYRKEWFKRNYQGERRGEYQAMCRAARARSKAKHGHAFTINERMSAGIRQSLRLGKGGWRWETIVGYTLDELAFHLARQFTKGMTWDEFMSGNIHIDHIVPKTDFQFGSYEDPGFKQCWALSNLRPMWAKENIQKNARRMYLL